MKVRDAMTPAPANCGPSTRIRLAAQLMADPECAALPVIDSGRLVGIITDRDITCRAVAQLPNASEQPVSRAMTRPVITVGADDPLEAATVLMEQNAIHHVPVINSDGTLVGILAQSDVGRRLSNRELGRMARLTSIPGRAVYARSAALVRKEP